MVPVTYGVYLCIHRDVGRPQRIDGGYAVRKEARARMNVLAASLCQRIDATSRRNGEDAVLIRYLNEVIGTVSVEREDTWHGDQ